MALKPFNSVAGYSVGEVPANIILANGDITTTNITTTGVSNLNSVGNVKITGGIAGQVISTDGAGNLSFITVSTAGLSNGTSNIAIFNNGNITFSVGGNANVGTFTGTGLNVAGTLNATGNANVGNLGTARVLATANVTAPQLISNVSTGTAPLVVSSTTLVSNLNADLLDGFNAATANTASTVVVRDANGNVSANFFIGDGSQLTGLPSGTSIANGNSNVSIPAANGNVNITAAGNTTLIITGTGVNVAGTLNATGNANVGNLGATGVTATTLGGSLTTASQPNITSVGTLTSLAVTGNATAGNVYANSGTIGASLLTGTLTTAAQPNITSVGTLSSLTVTNKVTAGQLQGEGGNISNIQGANVSGTVASATTATSATTAGTVTTNAQPNITSVGTLTSLAVTGNVTAGNFVGTFANGNSSISIPAANGNINLSAAGGATELILTATGANITGTLNATGNANVGNLGTAQVLASANVTAPQLISNVATGTAPFVVSSTTQVANLNAATAGTAGSATTAGTVTTNAQPNITSVGTLTSLAVTGNTTSGNVYANSGTIGASLLTGTLTTAAQPNITSVGTLTSLSVTGNVAAGNLTTTGVLSVTGTGVSSIAGNLDMTGNTIINLATPTNSTDAATKQYVDDVAQGLHTHDACQAATPDTLANISGGTVTYNNGTSGVGATLTTTGSYTTIDGVTLTNGMRILVKNEANTAHNGIYDRTSSTVLTRSSDFDTPAEMAGGDFTFVQSGTLYDNTGWVMPDAVATVGTSPVVWVQFSGAGTYTAGTGLTLTGSQFSITNTTVTAGSYGNGDRVATFTVNSQGQLTAASNVAITANAANLTGTTLNSSIVTSSLTSVGTLGSLSVTGNGTFGNVYANSGTIGASLLTGTLTTAAQPNVTSVGTLTSLNVSGNANVGNLGTARVIATGNISGTQLISNIATGTAPLVVSSTTQVANLNAATAGSATTAGTVTTAAQPNITSVGTLSSLTVSGNLSTGNISGTNGNLTTANISGNLILGNASVTTAISYGSVTTTAITANQTIASFSTTGVTGVEFLVKSIDSSGSKYGVATVVAVTDGTNVDYSTFATVNLGGYTGALAVNIVGGQVRLQVTPASSNSTVWTTQYRLI